MIRDSTREQIEDRAWEIARSQYKSVFSLRHDPAVLRMANTIAELVVEETLATIDAQEEAR